jgi:hypothetical protein
MRITATEPLLGDDETIPPFFSFPPIIHFNFLFYHPVILKLLLHLFFLTFSHTISGDSFKSMFEKAVGGEDMAAQV